jgi:tetratricopeptide (TPR) repeat protein
MDLQQNREAAQEVEAGLKRFPDQIELFNHLSQVYLLLNDVPAVQRICDRWAPLDTTSGRPERVRGRLALLRHDIDGAIRILGEAIRKNPAIATFHADLADALLREPTPERLALARTALQRAIDLDPGNPSYYQQLGSVLLQTGELELARQALLRALSLDPTHVEPYVSLVQVAQRLKRPATATLFARLERQVRADQREEGARWDRLRSDPQNPDARLAVAQALLQRGALAPAREHLEVAVARRPDWAHAQALLRRVRLLAEIQ